MELIILFIILILFLLHYNAKTRRNRSLLAKIPSMPSLPIFGHAIGFAPSPEILLSNALEHSKQLGRIVHYSLLGMPQVVISHPKLAEKILSNPKYLDKPNYYNFFTNWVGQSIFTITGKQWHQRRKTLTYAFHVQLLEQFIDIFDKQSNVFVGKLKSWKGNEIDVFHHVLLFAMDVLCETAMGYKLNCQIDSDSTYIKAVHEITNLISKRATNPFMFVDFIYNFTKSARREKELIKYLRDFSHDIICKRRKLLEDRKAQGEENSAYNKNGTKKKHFFMDLLLQTEENGQPLSNEDILNEVTLFMFAGHDTVASALTFALLNIAKYPEVQQKIYEEVHDIVKDGKCPTMQELKEMNYLEKVIKESLRLYPSAPFFSRVITEELDFEDYTLPVGTTVHFSPYLMGRHEENFKDPTRFDPSRFDDDKDLVGTSLLAFSSHQRSCLGQKYAILEMKTFLSKIVNNFEISVRDENREPRVMLEIVLRPVEGIFLSFKERATE